MIQPLYREDKQRQPDTAEGDDFAERECFTINKDRQ
jgi:hypothetical protein